MKILLSDRRIIVTVDVLSSSLQTDNDRLPQGSKFPTLFLLSIIKLFSFSHIHTLPYIKLQSLPPLSCSKKIMSIIYLILKIVYVMRTDCSNVY